MSDKVSPNLVIVPFSLQKQSYSRTAELNLQPLYKPSQAVKQLLVNLTIEIILDDYFISDVL